MNYLMLGFVAVFLQQVMASSAGVSVVSDGAYLAEGNTFLKLASKILACSVVAISSTFISLLVVNRYFKVPVRGNLLTVLLMCTVFVFAVSCPMVVLASLLKDRLKVYQMSFMLSLPTFVSSGYVWPLDQMPVALQVIIKALWPLVNFQRPFADVIFKGVPFYAVSGSILQTALYTVLWMPAAVWILKKNYMVRAKKC
jgi:ABC-2 type transport system permease protein